MGFGFFVFFAFKNYFCFFVFSVSLERLGCLNLSHLSRSSLNPFLATEPGKLADSMFPCSLGVFFLSSFQVFFFFVIVFATRV
jgi:hypothetical protein